MSVTMKILALDLGDAWVGTALSDALGILATPYQTVPFNELRPFLKTFFTKEKVATVVVGYPKTLKGTESEQTKKIIKEKELLEVEFPSYSWILWDERLTSKQAQQKMSPKDPKQKVHSIAAALILETYLMHKEFLKSLES